MEKLAALCLTFSHAALFSPASTGYEINNHADMSQRASEIGFPISGTNDKLFRLGLRRLAISDPRQTFALGAGLPPIPYCFGEFLPGGSFREYELTTAGGRVQDPAVVQPTGSKLTIAQLFRYGACFEDSETPDKKPLALFYNPPDAGRGLSFGIVVRGPSSLDWTLTRNATPSGNTGINHFTYMDARDFFYKAITKFTTIERDKNWALTFQALGHIAHHLQDMGSPQHTRNDTHCNANICATLGIDRPSGFEYYFDSQFRTVRALAATATAPMMFGLPREFWNINTSDASGGIAAYTSTSFTSAGKNFEASVSPSGLVYLRATGLPFPRPSGTFNDVNVGQLFPAASLSAVRDRLCGGTTANCRVRFMGTEQDPNARTASASVFSQELLNPAGSFVSRKAFQQNFFTYADAAPKLIPKAVEYSASLINYFFRGEMAIRLPAEGLYGIIDGGNPASTCKDSCGFPKLKLRLKNTTAAINGVAQDMVGGTLVGVVKFSRNSCYTSDWLRDPGELNSFDSGKVASCLLGRRAADYA